MSNNFCPDAEPGQPMLYQIRIQGHLDQQWTDWFGGLAITLEADGDTLLTGPVVDQAALHGLLRKIRDLGTPLISVNRVKQAKGPEPIHTWRSFMKAVVYTEYGSPDLLQLKEVAKPVPGDDEVLIKLHAVSVNRSDWEAVIGKPLYARIGGLLKPSRQILGSDIAGRVESVGRNVSQFQPGDEVFGDILERMGGFAEYVCAPAKALALKPTTITFEEAAALPQAAVIAVQGIRDTANTQAGRKILINGAGGSTGSFAVQLAKMYGAEVTGVDNTGKLDFMRSLGADHVIDYTREDFTQSGKQYDLILDLVAHRSVFAFPRALRANGTYFFVGGSVAIIFQILLLGPWIRRTTGKSVRLLVVRPNLKDLAYVAELCETRKVVPMIDRRYPLSEVPEAIRYLGEGHAKGKVVITM